MKSSQDSQQGGELHEPPTELDCGECEHYLKVIHNTQHITPYLINWHKWQVHIISFSKILPFIMLSALCTPYHVQGWLPYTDSICKIFYVQIMSYHQPILNVIYHKYVFSYVLSSPYTWMSRWSTSTTSSSSPPSLSALRSLAFTMLGV